LRKGGIGDSRTVTYDNLKRLVFDDPTLQLGLDDFGPAIDSFNINEHLIRCNRGAIAPHDGRNRYGSNNTGRNCRRGMLSDKGWADLRPQEIRWAFCEGGRNRGIKNPNQTRIMDWVGSANFRPVGRPDNVTIRPPRYSIKLEPNKTFAGRTETGRVGCKFCKSHKVVKNGKRGQKQLYLCKECGHQFIDNGCFPRMRTHAKAISAALEAYFDGLSLSKITNLLRRVFQITVNRSTIWEWIQKYVPLVKKLIGKLTVDAAHSWHVDETVVKVGGKLHWFWDGIDYDTRFIVNGLLTRTRTILGAKKFFADAKHQVGGKAPEWIVTDGCGVYRRGVSKTFWRKVQLGECKLVQKQGLRARVGELSNNIIERFHNTLKDRVKILRGFGNHSGARNALDGFVIQYNFLRRHMALIGRTPAEAARLKLPIENGWGDLIQWAII